MVPVILLCFRVQFGVNCDNNFSNKIKSNFKQPFFNKFESRFQAAFAFTNVLTQYNALAKIKIFHSSSHPEKAVIGKNGFYFYTNQADSILNNYAKSDRLSYRQLDSLCNQWSNNYAEMKKLNIKLIHGVWPNKSTLYKEYTPWQMKLIEGNGESRADQIIRSILIKNKNYPIIDTRPVLRLNKKKKTNLYYKYDTHWKTAGAFIAFKTMFPETQVAATTFNKIRIAAWKYDLVQLMGMCDSKLFQEAEYDYVPGFKDSIIDVQSKKYSGAYVATNSLAMEKKKVLLFGDSYILDTQFRTFLSWQYEHIIFFRNHIDMEIVRKEKPDIVIIGNVERYF